MKKYVLIGLLSFMMNGAVMAQSPVWAKETVSAVTENRDIDIDADENVYVAGYCSGFVEFPSTGGFISDGDIYVQKLDSAGNFQWVTLLGADDDFSAPQDDVRDILVDQSGNSYISGSYVDTTQSWATHIYIVKLDSDGNIEWEHTLGTGSGAEMTFAADGGILITGFFQDTTDFDPDLNTSFELIPDQGSFFLLKLGSDGTFEWVKQYGVTSSFSGGMSYQDIATDSNGMIYIAGGFSDTIDVDPGTGVVQFEAPPQSVLDTDMYLLKLDAQGDFVWAHHFDGNGSDLVRDIQVVNNHVVLQGVVSDQVDVNPDPIDVNSIDGSLGREGFILSLSLNGVFEWVNVYDATMLVLDTDSDGNVYSYGWIDGSVDFSQTSTPNIVTPTTAYNLYLLSLDSLGALTSVSNYDDQAEASAWLGMSRSDDGDYYILGNSTGSLFGLLPNVADLTFVAKLSSEMGQNSLTEVKETHIVLAPNPVDDLVNITSELAIDEILVHDAHGREIMRQTETSFDVSELGNGVYLVTIVSEHRRYTVRMIKN